MRFAPELRFFLLPCHRHAQVHLDPDPTSTLGHIVDSLGVPPTEVGAFTVHGAAVTSSYRPHPGDHVEVAAVERPQPLPQWPPTFLLDVHLGTLARRLRLLGVDTAYDNDRDDPSLVRQANAEGRVLLTRDRELLCRKNLHTGGHVRHDRPDDQLCEVLERFAPPLEPWTRCLACNGLLTSAAKGEVDEHLCAGTRATYDTFARCHSCGQVYWPGAHHERLEPIVCGAQALLDPG
ncbi:Mut7-C RNAse domain-containing protein [Nocardiopsis metallicus]|uniref:Twitching motility protein PilT n=1 Tax=Nocardiopsis metallicus TaxID=179819 RepID=A0A840W101_9ACTN|nr:hypothetical protein [Nocardiopsis metallicus]